MITLLFLFFNKILLLTYIINYLLEYELKKNLYSYKGWEGL